MNLDTTAVILLNWRRANDTIECIISLLDSGIKLTDIIIIDNDSQDNSVSKIKKAFPDAIVINSGRNGGFAFGCNIGVNYALQRHYKFIWLLNNDTIVNNNTLPEMLKIFEEDDVKSIGIVGSLIRFIDFPYDLQAVGGSKINYITGQSVNNLKITVDSDISFVTGASMLISMRTIEKIGSFNEDYFMYWEDAEFCMRAQESGFKMAVALNSLVLHKEGASLESDTPKKISLYNESQQRFFRNYSKTWLLIILTNRLLRTGKYIRRGEINLIKYLWRNII